MSHFSVVVATDSEGDWESQLAPYTESYDDEPTCYFDFEVEVDRKDFKSKATEIVDGLKKDDPDTAKYVKWLKEKKYTEIFKNWFGGELYKGSWGYWRNPEAKWDWYAFGGRWCAYFKAKEGKEGVRGEPSWGRPDNWKYPEGYFDQIKVEDIDWDGAVDEKIEATKKKWKEAEAYLEEQFKDFNKKHENLSDSDKEEERKKIFNEREWKFGFKRGDELSDLLDAIRGRGIRPFAFIDKDGKWHEEAKMGWWALTSDEKPDEYHKEWLDFLKGLEPDDLLTLVDCHI